MRGGVLQEIYGCTASAGEAEVLREHLLRRGVRLVGGEEEADWVIIHTCIVIEHTERRMVRRIREHLERGRGVIVAGCLPKARGEVLTGLKGEGRLYAVDTHEVPDMERVAEEVLKILRTGSPGEMPESGDAALTEKVGGFEGVERGVFAGGASSAPPRGIIPISTGCLGGCTYCIIRIARGRLQSFPEDYIVRRMKRLLAEGRREIYLTSQDTAAYGMEGGASSALPALLRRLTAIPGRYFIRVGMMNPWTATTALEEILDAFTDDHIYKFFHIPVQSGSDEVLQRMGRPYTAGEFVSLVEKIKERFPWCVLSTDIIVGFPGESEEDFEKSVELVERVKPPVLNITRFSPRPSTPAARFEGALPGWKVKERSRRLTELHRGISREFMEGWVGRTFKALAVELDRRRGTTLMRSAEYLPVVVEGLLAPGEFYEVEVVEAADFYVKGRLLR
ncbi:MAG: tRNA (N(6)-L-threonylcarbamoyladenosine(37)-C(2))-methylthiotransferase [Thermoplasmata archaeon]|nr:tRNA (N(6)-L-threonylcarbamoyladenosine(37)-C(2))-methylthiotransferase [Thermoplasmata archaeon]